MKGYEDRLYEQWKEQVQSALPSLLKRNLLAKPDLNIPSERDEDAEDQMEKNDTEIGIHNFHSSISILIINCFNGNKNRDSDSSKVIYIFILLTELIHSQPLKWFSTAILKIHNNY